MKRLLTLIFSLLCLATTQAEVWTAETLPMVYLSDSTRFVCNPDGVLSASAVDSLDRTLYSLRQRTGIQTILVAVKQVENGDTYTFGMALARKYKPGEKGKNNGLIIVLATADRSYRFLTGTGLQGTLPDALCFEIQDRYMVPFLKEGKWDEAMISAVNAVVREIDNDPEMKKGVGNDAEESSDIWTFAIIIVIIFGGVIAYYFSQPSCPNCGKRTLSWYRSENMGQDKKYIYTREYLKCYSCNHIIQKDRKKNLRLTQAANSPWLIFFVQILVFFLSAFRNGGRGGRGGGGSFGGGGFDGGGSGGKF